MAEQAKKQGPKSYCIEQLQKIEASGYDEKAVKQGLAAIKSVTDNVSQGKTLYETIEKLVKAKNGERAIKLLGVVKFRHKNMTKMIMALVWVLVIAGTVAYYVTRTG